MAESKSPPNRKLFHKAHYEIIAAQFRTALEPYFEFTWCTPEMTIARNVLVELAIEMAKRFKHDNEAFKPILFLNRCSPDLSQLPLGELWEVTNPGHSVKVPTGTNTSDAVANLDNIAAIREQSISDQRLK